MASSSLRLGLAHQKDQKVLGPGLLESAYEACFCHELRLSIRIGLLVNFNVTSLRQGLRRLSLPPPPPS